MAFTTTRKINAEMEARLKKLQSAKGFYVKVGVFGAEASKSRGDKNNLYLAQVHEFGADLPNGGRIPERSFLRGTARAERKNIARDQGKILDAFLKGQVKIEVALAILGETIVNRVRKRIKDGINPKLKPATVRRKGSSVPLIDTGQLINSIAYAVGKE